MGKHISMLGWVIFIVALFGGIGRTGPDDPITASMKASGTYGSVLTILGLLIGAVFSESSGKFAQP